MFKHNHGKLPVRTRMAHIKSNSTRTYLHDGGGEIRPFINKQILFYTIAVGMRNGIVIVAFLPFQP